MRRCVIAVLFGGILIGPLIGCGVVREAAQVAREELGPRALLKKYEWFKDTAAALDKKRADIKMYEQQLVDIKADYEGQQLPRDVRDDISQARREKNGIRASYNSLAANYNSQMAKENWKFCNAGSLPSGATEPLPREFATYENQ